MSFSLNTKQFELLVALNPGIPPEERKALVEKNPALKKGKREELLKKIR